MRLSRRSNWPHGTDFRRCGIGSAAHRGFGVGEPPAATTQTQESCQPQIAGRINGSDIHSRRLPPLRHAPAATVTSCDYLRHGRMLRRCDAENPGFRTKPSCQYAQSLLSISYKRPAVGPHRRAGGSARSLLPADLLRAPGRNGWGYAGAARCQSAAAGTTRFRIGLSTIFSRASTGLRSDSL